MITKSVKTTSGPLSITIPSEAKEITIGLLEQLKPEPGHSFSQLETLSILSGIPVDGDDDNPGLADICNVDDLKVFDETLQKLAYEIKHFEKYDKVPKYVDLWIGTTVKKKFFGQKNVKVSIIKTVRIAGNLSIEPAGAYFEAVELIKSEYDKWDKAKKYIMEQAEKNELIGLEYDNAVDFNPSIEAQIRLLSLYLHGPATGQRFNTQKIIEFDEVIRKMPITEALPIARHFFLSYPNLAKGTRKH